MMAPSIPLDAPPPLSSTSLEKDDLVQAFGLINATALNGKIGRVVVVPKEGRVGVRFVDHDKTKAIKFENLEPVNIDSHFHFEKKDIPNMAFLSKDGSPIQIRIENGRGKACAECTLDLGNKYHVEYDGRWYCEEDYVRKYVGRSSPIFRACALCLEYIPLSEAKALPTIEPLKTIYPDGKLPDGSQVGQPHNGDLVFFAHEKCFTCHVCSNPMYMQELTPNGFLMKRNHVEGEQPPLIFLCKSPPGSTGHCSNRYENVKAAKQRIRDIKALTVQELRQLLTERNTVIDEGEEKYSLVRKVVVTEKKREQKTAHVVTTHNSSSCVDVNTPGAFANNGCSGGSCGCEASIVKSRATPGRDFIDQSCSHSCPESLVCWDDRQRAWKRSVVRDFISQFFQLFLMTDSDSRTYFRRSGNISAFFNACCMTACYWVTDGLNALQSDEECFIPRFIWSVAVSAASTEDGSYKYVCAAVASSLIVSQVLNMNRNMDKMMNRKNDDYNKKSITKRILSGKLFRQLKEVEAGPNNLYMFMDSPDLRRCDCMQYVATAASIGKLRLKEQQVKEANVRCAYCHVALADPKYCSLCNLTAYCGRMCLKPHWKIHKKECRGRKKTS